MKIEEVEEILRTLRLLGLLAPQHVLITHEPLYKAEDGKIFFRGVSPKENRGVMLLSAQADASTVPHEWVHAALGLGEAAAYPFGEIMRLRYNLTKSFPLLKAAPRLFEVKYRPAEVPEKYKGRLEHYVKA